MSLKLSTIYKVIKLIMPHYGCGSVGRAVASDTRGPWFESSHWRNLYFTLFTVNCIEKTKIKKKRPGMAHLKKKCSIFPGLSLIFHLFKFSRTNIRVGLSHLLALVRDPQCHLGQELWVRLEDVVDVSFDILLQEERAHVRRRMKRLIFQKISTNFDAGFFNFLVLPVAQKVVQQVQRVSDASGLQESIGCGSCRKI